MELDLGAGEGCRWQRSHEDVILLLTWTAREVMVMRNVTADRTTLPRVCQEHSTGIKNKNCNFANL